MVGQEMAFAPRYGGRFFGRRVNCEEVPFLPAWAVAQALDGPKEAPYVLTWNGRSHGGIQETVRIVRSSEAGAVEIRRQDQTSDFIRTILRPLPRNGGTFRLLICPNCGIARRGLYGWEPGGRFTTSTVSSAWGCRACNRLRYASEGGALVQRGRGRIFDRLFGRCGSDRPEPWYPNVFTSPAEVPKAGIRW